MSKDLRTSVLAVVVLTLVLGLAYPLAMTGVAQLAFPGAADGRLITDAAGETVGSELLARKADAPRLFQPRPSATDYDPAATYFSNRGPNAATARFFYRDAIAAYVRRNGRDTPGLSAATVPVDAVTTSASGVDPLISEANAAIQARRVARVRGVPLADITRLVEQHRTGRWLGVFGEPGINTTTLNLALEGTRP